MEQGIDHATAERRARQAAWAETQKAREATGRLSLQQAIESARADRIRMLRMRLMDEDEKSSPSTFIMAKCQLDLVELTGKTFEVLHFEWEKTPIGILARARERRMCRS